MSLTPKFIPEDGSCVPGANTWALPEDGYQYFEFRFGGEKWDRSYEGEQHCPRDICRALLTAVDVLKCFDWLPVPHKCNCCENDLPNPLVCCDCDPCHKVIDRLKEAQLLIADAILNGWNPWGAGQTKTPHYVDSISMPGEGSISFAQSVDLNTLQGCGKSFLNPDPAAGLMERLNNLLGCYLCPYDDSIRVLS